MIRYFTSWYDEKNEERRAELITCIRKCCESFDVDFVYLLCESPAPLMHPKLKEIPVSTRPTYNDFFLLSNAVSNPEDVVIVCNTDIYPEFGLGLQLHDLKQNDCWALSRWDIPPHGGNAIHFERRDSMDSWVFRAPIRHIEGNFILGKAGCDNAIAYNISAVGYNISNPSKEVKFYHLHNSGIRNYIATDAVPSPYLLVSPTRLRETVTTQILSRPVTVNNPITPDINNPNTYYVPK